MFFCPWGFSRQEYWSGFLCLPPGEFPNPGIEPKSPALQADSLPSEPQGSICLQCGRPGFDPWVGKISWRRKWQPTPVLLPGKSHRQRSLVGYSPWGRKESDTIEWYIVWPCWLSILYVVVCICYSQTANLSFPPLFPLVTVSLLSMSVIHVQLHGHMGLVAAVPDIRTIEDTIHASHYDIRSQVVICLC